jgi:hypothetical protein
MELKIPATSATAASDDVTVQKVLTTRIRELRSLGISLIILGPLSSDPQVEATQIWIINEQSSALMKYYAHDMLHSSSHPLFANQTHIVKRGVNAPDDSHVCPQSVLVQELIHDVCSYLRGALRVLVQCDSTLQMWFGRRDFMDRNALEPLFRHVYEYGCTRFA